MAASSRPAPFEGRWTGRAKVLDEWMYQHKVVVSATSASLVSTFAGFPLDSLKSRLQSSRESLTIPRLAADVIKEEGIGGLWRGFPLPLITISIVRTISFTIYTSTKRILNSIPGATPTPDAPRVNVGNNQASPTSSGSSSSQYAAKKPWMDIKLNLFTGENAMDVALTSLIAGAASGGVVCLGSAPFELVKVRRQLEYQIYRDSHPDLFGPNSSSSSSSIPPSSDARSSIQSQTSTPIRPQVHLNRPQPAHFNPPTTLQAVRLIIQSSGLLGLYTGFRLHFIRDTLGTALYFAEYDVMRYWLGRKRIISNHDGTGIGSGRGSEGEGELAQGDLPDWARWLPKGFVPFLCGSLAGVTSWALIYPVDAIKTKAQQRALSGLSPRTPLTQLTRLVRGTDPENPKPLLRGIARLYRGLGISMIRSMLTHGLLWTLVDWTGAWIDTNPLERLSTTIV